VEGGVEEKQDDREKRDEIETEIDQAEAADRQRADPRQRVLSGYGACVQTLPSMG